MQEECHFTRKADISKAHISFGLPFLSTEHRPEHRLCSDEKFRPVKCISAPTATFHKGKSMLVHQFVECFRALESVCLGFSYFERKLLLTFIDIDSYA